MQCSTGILSTGILSTGILQPYIAVKNIQVCMTFSYKLYPERSSIFPSPTSKLAKIAVEENTRLASPAY